VMRKTFEELGGERALASDISPTGKEKRFSCDVNKASTCQKHSLSSK